MDTGLAWPVLCRPRSVPVASAWESAVRGREGWWGGGDVPSEVMGASQVPARRRSGILSHRHKRCSMARQKTQPSCLFTDLPDTALRSMWDVVMLKSHSSFIRNSHLTECAVVLFAKSSNFIVLLCPGLKSTAKIISGRDKGSSHDNGKGEATI